MHGSPPFQAFNLLSFLDVMGNVTPADADGRVRGHVGLRGSHPGGIGVAIALVPFGLVLTETPMPYVPPLAGLGLVAVTVLLALSATVAISFRPCSPARSARSQR